MLMHLYNVEQGLLSVNCAIRFSINFLAHLAFILVFNEKLGEIHAIKLILTKRCCIVGVSQG
jgi:hypothetical protein